MIVEVEYRLCQYNKTEEGDEVIFPYNGKWYRIKVEDMPSEYLKYRMLELWITQNVQFDVELNIDLSKPCVVRIDLSKAEEIPESYPI